MGTEFVNVTVNTFSLYKTSTRSYGTVGIVGVGGTANTEPVTIGSWNEADTLYSSTALGVGVKAALINGASKVIAVDAGASTLVAITAGLAKLQSRDVQIVALAGLAELADTAYISTALTEHVNGAGISRIGVFQLAKGEDATTMPSSMAGILSGNNSRMFGIAHNSTSDVACSVAGLIASIKAWESPLMKPLVGVAQTSGFTTAQLEGLETAQLNALVTPTYVTGNAFVIGSAFTQGSSVSGMMFIDTRRVVDDIAYKLKAGLTDPGIIGNVQITKPGLSIMLGRLTGILANCVNISEIEAFEIGCPLIDALAKDVNSRSAGEVTLITTARTSRVVDVSVIITYAGVLHQIDIDVKMVA